MRRHFTPEFKDEAVKHGRERGQSIAQAARELGLGESTLGRWVQLAEGNAATRDQAEEVGRDGEWRQKLQVSAWWTGVWEARRAG